jgi:hypothetical protein
MESEIEILKNEKKEAIAVIRNKYNKKISEVKKKYKDQEKIKRNNDKAYNCILNKDVKGLDKCVFQIHLLISQFKNNLDGLEFLLKYLDYDPGAGSYFYTDVEDNKTFDLYHKYRITACNLNKEHISEEQWEYLYKIKYINKTEYTQGYA